MKNPFKTGITADSTPANPLFVLNTGQELDKLFVVNTGTGSSTFDIGTSWAGTDVVSSQTVGAGERVTIDIGGVFEHLGNARMKLYIKSASWTNVSLNIYSEISDVADFDRLTGTPQVLAHVEGGAWGSVMAQDEWKLLTPTLYNATGVGGELWRYEYDANYKLILNGAITVFYGSATAATLKNRGFFLNGAAHASTKTYTYTGGTFSASNAKIGDKLLQKYTANGVSITVYRATNWAYFNY